MNVVDDDLANREPLSRTAGDKREPDQQRLQQDLRGRFVPKPVG